MLNTGLRYYMTRRDTRYHFSNAMFSNTTVLVTPKCVRRSTRSLDVQSVLAINRFLLLEILEVEKSHHTRRYTLEYDTYSTLELEPI